MSAVKPMAVRTTKADEVRRAFREQAGHCVRLGSPFMQRLCTLLADRLVGSNEVFAHVLQWPGDPDASHDALPLRLCGALHCLVLAGEDEGLEQVYLPNHVADDALWQAVEAAAQPHAATILTYLQSPPQTNEVCRSAVLLPGFLEIARRFPGRPLVTSELGASAGLNMNWDRYRYRLGAFAWGDADPAARRWRPRHRARGSRLAALRGRWRRARRRPVADDLARRQRPPPRPRRPPRPLDRLARRCVILRRPRFV
jgi:hypothetical protein